MDAAFLLQLSAPAPPAGVNPGQGHVNEAQTAAAARLEAINNRTQERQQQSNRLVTAYRFVARQLLQFCQTDRPRSSCRYVPLLGSQPHRCTTLTRHSPHHAAHQG